MISGRVIGKQIDENGNIKVQTEYTLSDGSKVIGNSRYAFHNFTKEKVLVDIKAHCESLMIKTFSLKEHQKMIKSVDLSDVVYECESVEITVKPEVKNLDGTISKPKETIIANDIDDSLSSIEESKNMS